MKAQTFILFAGSAAVGIGWAALRRIPPAPPPAPSLATVQPASVSSAQLNKMVDGKGISIDSWQAAPGVSLASPEDRRRAVEIETRVLYSTLSSPRETTVGGRPAVEIAAARSWWRDQWILFTYVFDNRRVTRVRCDCEFWTPRGNWLTGEGSAQEWAAMLPGCAAVVGSSKVVQ